MTLHRPHFWLGSAHAARKTRLALAMAAVTVAYLAARNPAVAVPITYNFIPPIAAGTDITITGDFTFDPNGTVLSAANLYVTNGPEPGPYTAPFDAAASFIAIEQAVSTVVLVIIFADDLGPAADEVTKIQFVGLPNNMNMSFAATAGTATPLATPTPEPGSLALLAAAIGLFLVMRRVGSPLTTPCRRSRQ
jgi:hypothetical protein